MDINVFYSTFTNVFFIFVAFFTFFNVFLIFLSRFLHLWYKIEIYLYCRTNRKSYMVCRTAPFLMTLNTPGFKVTLFFDAEYIRNSTRYRHSFNGIPIGTYIRLYSTASFRMTLSDLEWLSKICDDTKHRAASLRQQSYLFYSHSIATTALSCII